MEGLPREASLVCTRQPGTTARRPGLLSGPAGSLLRQLLSGELAGATCH